MTRRPIATLAALAAAALFQAPALAETVKLQVNGMVCAFCAQGIEKRVTAMPEAGPMYINLAQKVVAVEPRPGRKIDVEKLKAEVTDAGYDVVKVETVPQTVAAIRAEMKAQKAAKGS